MEDENGLELSLGLSCGASSAKSKGIHRQESALRSRRSGSGKPSDGRGSESSIKRKMSFDENNNQRKHERETRYSDSHISISTDDDGSIAGNDDLEDSEVGSTSKPVSNHDNGTKQFGNFSFDNPYPTQSATVLNPTYRISIKDPNSAGTPSMMESIAGTTNERSGTQSTNTFTFGYSPVGIVTYPLQPPLPSYSGGGPLNSDQHNDELKTSQGPVQANVQPSSDSSQHEGRTLERTRVEDKQHTTESAASSRVENLQGSNINLRANNAPERPGGDGFSLDFSAIKPGIAAELKFGGSGSYPNLPWVSTTGSGPHGRTISGVTYRYGASQIRIVCVCHGTHMTPEEFVRHASEEYAIPENNIGLATFPSTNPAASAQS